MKRLARLPGLIFAVILVFTALPVQATDDDTLPSLEWVLKDRVHVGFKGYVQTGFYFSKREDTGRFAERADIAVTGAALTITAAVPERRADMKLKFDLSRANPVEDAYLSLRPHAWANFRIGQFKSPFDRQSIASGEYRLFPQRSNASETLGIGRLPGMMLHGYGSSRWLSYFTGVFDMSGSSRSLSSQEESERDLTWMGRLVWSPRGWIPSREGPLTGIPPKELRIALAGALALHYDRGYDDVVLRATSDLAVTHRGFWGFVALYHHRDPEHHSHRNAWGGTSELSYRPGSSPVLLGGRYSQTVYKETSSDRRWQAGPVLSYHPYADHNLKATVTYLYGQRMDADGTLFLHHDVALHAQFIF